MPIAPGRTAIITGGASGFGLEIARRLVATGARVASFDTSAVALDAAVRELGDSYLPISIDVRDGRAIVDAVDRVEARFGSLDTVVISAGVIHIKPLAEVTEDDWDTTLDVNLKGAFLVCQAAASHLVASGPRGRIVAISSDAGKRGFPSIAAYTASKFGLIGLIESIAVELAAAGVTANVVCPVGAPETGMGRAVLAAKVETSGSTPDAIVAAAAAGNPLRRNATVADVAAAVAYFLSDEAAFLTGVALDVDGGAHLGYLPGT